MDKMADIIITCKNGDEQNLPEGKSLKSENKGIESLVKESKLKDTELNVNVEINSKNSDEITNSNSNKVLKRKMMEDRVVVETILSDGEASSGLETVSSTKSKVDDIDVLELSSSNNGDGDDDCNIIVKVINDMAFQNKNRRGERFPYHETNSISNQKTNSSKFTSRRHNGSRSSKETKYQQRNNVDKNYNYDRRDRVSNEPKYFDHFRQRICYKYWNTYREQVKRPGRVRWEGSEGRFRQSRSKEHTGGFRGSLSPGRFVRNRSPSYKDAKKESRYSRSFDENSIKSSPERSSQPRKKRHNSSATVSSSFRKQLDNRKSPKRIKKDEIHSDKKYYFDTLSRKKERTPFLVELEKKLKEVERSKNNKQEPNEPTYSIKASGNESTLIPPLPTIGQSCNSSLPLTYTTTVPHLQGPTYDVPHRSMPTVSVNNSPPVPEPLEMPVHIMGNGEQIPQDLDGRPIPVGPNGHYLPENPAGRIFAHIVSPKKQEVPIHKTEGGVLRLANSEPIPLYPEHQLPVNIEGGVIPIEPVCKPLRPCSDIPKNSPINTLPKMDLRGNERVRKTVLDSIPPPQMEFQEIVQITTTETRTENHVIDFSLLNLIQNPSEEANKAELLNKYKKKAQQKSEDVLKCIEIEKNLGINPSKGGVRRSIPIKLSQKKTSISGSDIVLDSGHPGTTSAIKSVTEPKKGPFEEILINSNDEADILGKNCDKKVCEKSNLETKFEDYITEKVQRALKLLNEKDHMPPAVGRFIISDVNPIPSMCNSPNESPLLRNRIQLSFLTPNSSPKDQPIEVTESKVKFKFLSQNKYIQKIERKPESKQKTSNPAPIPVFTFDFAMQCDFTSEIIRNLNFKISSLEMEIMRLKHKNANLFDDFRIVKNAKHKKSEELKKALLKIQDKNKEIRSLKRSMEPLE